MSTNKQLLIVERSLYALNSIVALDENGNKKYIFEGIFAVLNEMNRNRRIYTADQYIPQITNLMPKIKQLKVLGEANHPTDRFDNDITKVSHIVEDLRYDKEKGLIYGRIRLLNTPNGKIIQSLVDDGIPIHISSRAAGSVNPDGTVVMKQLFTYDIVSEPGFEQAELNRVNEKYGFTDIDGLYLYEVNSTDECECGEPLMNGKCPVCTISKDKTISPEVAAKGKDSELITDKKCATENKNENVIYNKKERNMDNYITKEQFEYLNRQVKNLSEKLREKNSSTYANENKFNAVSTSKYKELEDKYNSLVEFVNYLSENVNKSIAHGDHIVENVTSIKEYIDYLATNVDKNVSYTKYLSEKVEQSIDYSENIGSMLNKTINYSNHLAEGIKDVQNETINNRRYSEYIAENADKGIQYAEHLGEILDKGIQYSEDLGEKLNKTIHYTNHLGENINKAISYADHLGESINGLSGSTGIPQASRKIGYEETLDQKLNLILESAKKQNAISANSTHFLNFLDSSNVRRFSTLNETVKTRVIDAFEKNKFFSTSEANEIFENAINPKNAFSDFEPLKFMKPHHKAMWTNLNESRKQEIIKLSNNYLLTNQAQIDNFFDSVDMRNESFNMQSLNENKIENNSTVTDSFLIEFEKDMNNRNKRF